MEDRDQTDPPKKPIVTFQVGIVEWVEGISASKTNQNGMYINITSKREFKGHWAWKKTTYEEKYDNAVQVRSIRVNYITMAAMSWLEAHSAPPDLRNSISPEFGFCRNSISSKL